MRRHCICKFVRVTIIYRHRYIRDAHAVWPSRAHLCGERANDFSTCSGYEWAPRRVGFTQTFFSSSWSILRTFGAIAGPWFPPEDKKKSIRDFLDGRIFRNYNILLGPERFIYVPKHSRNFIFEFSSIYLFTSFSNFLYQNIALGYFALFFYPTKIHVPCLSDIKSVRICVTSVADI